MDERLSRVVLAFVSVFVRCFVPDCVSFVPVSLFVSRRTGYEAHSYLATVANPMLSARTPVHVRLHLETAPTPTFRITRQTMCRL